MPCFGLAQQSAQPVTTYRYPVPEYGGREVVAPPFKRSQAYQAAQQQTSESRPIPRIDPNQWWPDEPVQHDTQVQPSNFEAESAPMVERVASSANDVLSGLKDQATKLSGAVENVDLTNVDWSEAVKDKFAGADIQKMFGSLAVVLGLYFGFVWVWRRFSPASFGGLPSEVLQVVGQAPFGPKKTLQLVRLGSKLLLLINGPSGTQPIGEVTEPEEVKRLTALCTGRSYQSTQQESALQEFASQVRAGSYTAQTTPFVAPMMQPQMFAAPVMQQPVMPPSQTGELERILQSLTEAVQNSNRGREFEA